MEVATRLQISPASATPPNCDPIPYHQQEDQLHFLQGRHYGLQGEIMASAVILIFAIFLLLLIVLICLRRRNQAREMTYNYSVDQGNEIRDSH
ncbi:unnamed protein product [Ilex paraguariensis]|uniref:Uncharacterized protein n=1 Tax=Ilex paraguariensis TaxID=185542 RepID=A0ABC8TVV9_9AQUA